MAEGIKKEHTVPHTPQQNGVVEWKNKTMVGAAKAMLFDQGLPLFLWVEAYRTAIYIRNMFPQTNFWRKKPEEVFTGTIPYVSHVHIFGNVMFMLTIGRTWTLLERRGYLLDIARLRTNTEYTYLLARGPL